ncbi:MAG: SIS domain-containing protein [Beutenbergiaceae bacterium]
MTEVIGQGAASDQLAASDLPVLERVADLLPTLRRSERKVADVVLSTPSEVLQSTMAQLAAMADVSEPTVMRFCNAIGIDGYQTFRLELARSLALGLPPTQSAITVADGPDLLISKVFDHTITSLDRARRRLDPDQIEAAISALATARSIIFFGFGASGIVAQDAQQKFPLFGVPCEAFVDGHQQFMAASMAGADTVCVAISNTGRTTGLIQAVQVASENDCTVIALTGEHSELYDLATIPLLVTTFEDTDAYTPTTSRLAALAVVDILATGVAMRRDPEHMERLRRMKTQLSDMRSISPRDRSGPAGHSAKETEPEDPAQFTR